MAKGGIVINENRCTGCGLCQHFCARGCIHLADKGKLGAKGHVLPLFVAPEKCTGCGVCGWLCPDFAIEVFRFDEE